MVYNPLAKKLTFIQTKKNMKKKYFSINQSGGENNHIATITAESNEEFANKIALACSEHFDLLL